MKRVIKFRGWDPVRREWIYGYYSTFGERAFITEPGKPGIPEQVIAVVPESVGQFTGLTDKSHGAIYEGDLMLTDDMYHDREDGVAINALPDGKIHPVDFRDGGFFAGGELLHEYATAWQVVGNIFENPELI